jgi:hypothetical protein
MLKQSWPTSPQGLVPLNDVCKTCWANLSFITNKQTKRLAAMLIHCLWYQKSEGQRTTWQKRQRNVSLKIEYPRPTGGRSFGRCLCCLTFLGAFEVLTWATNWASKSCTWLLSLLWSIEEPQNLQNRCSECCPTSNRTPLPKRWRCDQAWNVPPGDAVDGMTGGYESLGILPECWDP